MHDDVIRLKYNRNIINSEIVSNVRAVFVLVIVSVDGFPIGSNIYFS